MSGEEIPELNYHCHLYAGGKQLTHRALSAVWRPRGRFAVVDEGAGRFVIECERMEDVTDLQFGDIVDRIPFRKP